MASGKLVNVALRSIKSKFCAKYSAPTHFDLRLEGEDAELIEDNLTENVTIDTNFSVKAELLANIRVIRASRSSILHLFCIQKNHPTFGLHSTCVVLLL